MGEETEQTPEVTYSLLKAEFDQTYTRDVGGVTLTYVTGESVITRLNEVLGFDTWSFETGDPVIVEDQIYIKGTLSIMAEGAKYASIMKEAWGGAQIKRIRSTGGMLDLGNDIKSAATDALKKAASLIGVGLYLSAKSPVADTQRSNGFTAPSTNHSGFVTNTPSATSTMCVDCGEDLKETRFKDGNVWSPQQLANMGTRKFGRVLCMSHYREAKAQPTQADMATALPY